MMKFISAVMASIRQGMQTALDKLVGVAGGVIAFPFQVFGLGTSQSMPSQPPVFDAPVSPTDLVGVRDLDRDGVNTVFRLAKMSKDERATADLSAIERADIRALLLQMTQSELDALTRQGPGAVRKLIGGGDARVWGVPSALPEDILPPSDTELALRLRAVKAAMAKPRGSAPFRMPTM
jgi:hypothetical protein